MIFKVDTILRKRIRLTKERWNKIITEKHPMMKEHIDNIQETVKKPDLIRKSKWDEKVYLFYRRSAEYYIYVVVKMENSTGFIITTYITNKIKIGAEIWKK